MVGSAAQAEEIVQDAFTAVNERWTTLDRPGGYLRRTAVNGCAQVLRRRETETRANRLALAAVSHTELPGHLVELRESLDRLSERQRIVIVLRYFVDLPDQEIAELLGVSHSTVRSLAQRALNTLRKELR